MFLNPFKDPSREELMEKAVSEMIHVLISDDIIDFSHLEQSKIINEVLIRYKDRKSKEHAKAVEIAHEIKESINEIL